MLSRPERRRRAELRAIGLVELVPYGCTSQHCELVAS
jgi:hypothetical protein